MSATMNAVARAAGVSLKTVSNVVNGYQYIREATRARVQDAVVELDYHVNIAARNLRAGRTGMIGLAVPELSLPYFAELADSVIRAAESHGLTVLIEQTSASRDRELEALWGQGRRMTDRLIFSPLALGSDDRDRFAVSFRMVLLGERIFRPQADHVSMANVDGAYAATQHLIDLGCRRIAGYSSPSLSSVAPGREQIARTAVNLLVDRIAPGVAEPR